MNKNYKPANPKGTGHLPPQERSRRRAERERKRKLAENLRTDEDDYASPRRK